MRLICPNCEAQYEVDGRVIPEGGRDVQCSNCGHTWFQPAEGETAEPEHAQAHDAPARRAQEPDTDPDVLDDLDESEPAAGEDADVEADYADEPQDDDAAAIADVVASVVPTRKQLDDDIKEVLQEEAAREAEARQADTAGLETQPDLGLDENAEDRAAKRRTAARDRAARLRGAAPGAGAVLEADTADDQGDEPRSGLLPDVDEINSTLRPATDRTRGDAAAEPDEPEDEPRRRSGFRLGFGLAMLVTAIGALVYIFSPQIVAAVPQTEPILLDYVDWVNRTREAIGTAVDNGLARFSEVLEKLNRGENTPG